MSDNKSFVQPIQLIYLTIDDYQFDNKKVQQSFECKVSINGVALDVLSQIKVQLEIPIFSYEDSINLLFCTPQNEIIGSISFVLGLFVEQRVVSRWQIDRQNKIKIYFYKITLFEPDDDNYDGDFLEDDKEFPRVLLNFQMSLSQNEYISTEQSKYVYMSNLNSMNGLEMNNNDCINNNLNTNSNICAYNIPLNNKSQQIQNTRSINAKQFNDENNEFNQIQQIDSLKNNQEMELSYKEFDKIKKDFEDELQKIKQTTLEFSKERDSFLKSQKLSTANLTYESVTEKICQKINEYVLHNKIQKKQNEYISSLEKDVCSLKASLSTRDINIKDLEQKLKILKQREEQFLVQISALNVVIDDIKSQNLEFKQQCSDNQELFKTSQRNQIDFLKLKRDVENDIKQKYEQQINRFDQEIRYLQEQIQKKQEKEIDNELKLKEYELQFKIQERKIQQLLQKEVDSESNTNLKQKSDDQIIQQISQSSMIEQIKKNYEVNINNLQDILRGKEKLISQLNEQVKKQQKNENNQYQSNVSQKSHNSNTKIEQMDILEKEIIKTSELLQQKELRLNEAVYENNDLRENNFNLQQKLNILRSEGITQSSLIQQKSKELEGQVVELREKHYSEYHERELIQAKYERLQADYTQQNQNNTNKEVEISKLKSCLSEFQYENSQIPELKDQIKIFEVKYQQIYIQNQDLVVINQELMQKNIIQEESAKQVNIQKDSLLQRQEETQQQCLTLNDQNEKLSQRIQELLNELILLQVEKDEWQFKYNNTIDENNCIIQEQKSMIEEDHNKIQKYEKIIKDQLIKEEQLNNELNKLRQTIITIQNTIENTNVVLNCEQNQNAQIQDELIRTNLKNKDLENQLKEVQTQNNELKDREDGFKKDIENISQNLTFKHQELIQYQDQINMIIQQNEEYKDQDSKNVEYMNKIMKQKQQEIEDLHKQVELLQLQIENNSNSSENKLMLLIKQYENRLSVLNEQINQIQKKNEDDKQEFKKALIKEKEEEINKIKQLFEDQVSCLENGELRDMKIEIKQLQINLQCSEESLRKQIEQSHQYIMKAKVYENIINELNSKIILQEQINNDIQIQFEQQIQSYQKKINTINLENQRHVEEIQDSNRANLIELNGQISQLNQKLIVSKNEFESQILSQQQQIENIQNEREEKCASLKIQCTKQSEELIGSFTECNILRQKLVEYEFQEKEQKKIDEKKQEQYETLQNQYIRQIEANERLENEILKEKQSIQLLQYEIKEQLDINDSIISKTQQQQQKNDLLEENFSEQQVNQKKQCIIIQEQEKQIKSLENKLQGIQTNEEQIMILNKDQIGINNSQKLKIDELQKQNDYFQSEINELNTIIQQLNIQIQKYQNEQNESIDISSLKQNQLKNTIEELENKQIVLQDQIKQMTNENQIIQNQYEEINEQIKQHKSEIILLNDQIKLLQIQIKEKDNEMDKIQKINYKKHSELGDYQKNIEQIQNQNIQCHQQNDQLITVIEKNNQAVEQYKNQIEQLQQQIKQFIIDLESSKIKLELQQQENEQQQSELQSLQKQINEQKLQMSQLQEENQTIKDYSIKDKSEQEKLINKMSEKERDEKQILLQTVEDLKVKQNQLEHEFMGVNKQLEYARVQDEEKFNFRFKDEQKRYTDLMEKYLILENNYNKQFEKITLNENMLKEFQESGENKSNNDQSIFDKIQSENNQLKLKIDSLNQENVVLKNELDQTLIGYNALKEEIELLNKMPAHKYKSNVNEFQTNHKEQIEEAEKLMTEMKLKLSEKERELVQIQAELQAKLSEESLSKKIEEIRNPQELETNQEKKYQQIESDELQIHLNKCPQEKCSMLQTINELENQIQKVIEQNEQLTLQIEKKNMEYQDLLQKQNESERIQSEDMKALFKQLQEKVQEMETNHKINEETIAKLKQKNEYDEVNLNQGYNKFTNEQNHSGQSKENEQLLTQISEQEKQILKYKEQLRETKSINNQIIFSLEEDHSKNINQKNDHIQQLDQRYEKLKQQYEQLEGHNIDSIQRIVSETKEIIDRILNEKDIDQKEFTNEESRLIKINENLVEKLSKIISTIQMNHIEDLNIVENEDVNKYLTINSEKVDQIVLKDEIIQLKDQQIIDFITEKDASEKKYKELFIKNGELLKVIKEISTRNQELIYQNEELSDIFEKNQYKIQELSEQYQQRINEIHLLQEQLNSQALNFSPEHHKSSFYEIKDDINIIANNLINNDISNVPLQTNDSTSYYYEKELQQQEFFFEKYPFAHTQMQPLNSFHQLCSYNGLSYEDLLKKVLSLKDELIVIKLQDEQKQIRLEECQKELEIMRTQQNEIEYQLIQQQNTQLKNSQKNNNNNNSSATQMSLLINPSNKQPITELSVTNFNSTTPIQITNTFEALDPNSNEFQDNLEINQESQAVLMAQSEATLFKLKFELEREMNIRNSLNDEIYILKKDIEEFIKQNDDLIQKNDDLIKQNDDLLRQNNDLKQEVKELINSLKYYQQQGFNQTQQLPNHQTRIYDDNTCTPKQQCKNKSDLQLNDMLQKQVEMIDILQLENIKLFQENEQLKENLGKNLDELQLKNDEIQMKYEEKFKQFNSGYLVKHSYLIKENEEINSLYKQLTQSYENIVIQNNLLKEQNKSLFDDIQRLKQSNSQQIKIDKFLADSENVLIGRASSHQSPYKSPQKSSNSVRNIKDLTEQNKKSAERSKTPENILNQQDLIENYSPQFQKFKSGQDKQNQNEYYCNNRRGSNSQISCLNDNFCDIQNIDSLTNSNNIIHLKNSSKLPPSNSKKNSISSLYTQQIADGNKDKDAQLQLNQKSSILNQYQNPYQSASKSSKYDKYNTSQNSHSKNSLMQLKAIASKESPFK